MDLHIAGRNDAPVVVSPVSNVVVNQNSAPTTVELAGRVSDLDQGDTLTFVAASSNGKLVQTSVVGSQLKLNYQPNASGIATVTVTALDRTGAGVKFSFQVHVQSPQEQVDVIVVRLANLDDGVLNKGDSSALEKKILDGLKKLDGGQTKTAVNNVQAFINQVSALVRSGRLSNRDGNKLIDLSNDLIASVGG